MPRVRSHWIGTLGALALCSFAGAVGCGDDGDGSGGSEDGGCFDYDGLAMGDPVSFADDVVPIFEQSCGLTTTCHGDESNPTDTLGFRPYLASITPGTTDIDLTIASNVDKASTQAEGMPIIKSGQPENSYLMHKMDGTHDTCSVVRCVDDDCKSVMPQNGTPIAASSRDIVRRWILQGAKKT